MVKKYLILSIPFLLTVFLLLTLLSSISQAAQEIVQPTLPAVQSSPDPQQWINRTKLHPNLIKALSSGENIEQIPIIIEWGGQSYAEVLNESLDMLAKKNANRLQTNTQVIASLQVYASEQSGALRTALQAAELLGQASDIQSFWVSPIIAAKATPALIEDLINRDDIAQIRLDERLYLEKMDFHVQDSGSGVSWNLELIGAGLAEQRLGLDGSGVVVANLDTGVDWQHPALLKKYRGYNPHGPAQHLGNWFVVTKEPYLVPGDSDGHGTHTMGTMVGDDEAGIRTGVAPGARWIAVKLFNNQGYTYESWIHAAFQWVMAPEGNPALAPDIVNCSWGSSNGGDVRFRSAVTALRSAGIFPVFSAGNDGPSSYTIGSPASFPESFSVGAVDQYRYTALFSSRGPSPWNEIKPEVAAPGVNILSTFPGNGYATANGTSMAAPHVAGLAALLLQADSSLTPDEIEEIIKTTADPLGTIRPNNDTGWGFVNAYAAGLKVTPHGELVGVVRQAGINSPVPFPMLFAKPLDQPEQSLPTSGKIDGTYTFALRPGRYDLSVSAFGFLSDTIHNIAILTGTQTSMDVALVAAPAGFLSGKITDLNSNLPLSATLTVEETPVRVQTDPATGLYYLSLPEGSWKVKITSQAHRTGHITPTITAGSSGTWNVSLLPAPKILLVDAGRWYNSSQISYYKDALDALDLPYREWPIRSLGLGGTDDERPLDADFNPYDVVIWSDPFSSPGWIGSNAVITNYLKTGGHFFISGEDVLYLDGGGSSYSFPAPYMLKEMGIQYNGEGNLSPLNGAPGSFFEGIQLTLNPPDSSQQQQWPDEAQIRSPLKTNPSLTWPDQSIGSVTAGFCQPYKAFWTGFGFEGAGPRTSRIELLDRILQWFEKIPDPYGIKIYSSSAPLIGSSGSVVTQTIQVNNTGTLTDIYNLQVTGSAWPLDIELPDGNHVQGNTSFPLGSCQGEAITTTITIPAGQPRDAQVLYRLEFTSQNNPQIHEALTLTAKTYAPVLLVEHQIWYQNIAPYTQTLTSLGIPYDIAHTQSSSITPSYNTLKNYPIIIWTAGYNWYNPLGIDGEQQLTQYLDQGGRLLLSSQDLLDVNGLSKFVQDRLGVVDFTLSVTPTEVTGAQNHPFHSNLGLWNLTFPYANWGDGLKASKSTLVILEDQNPMPVGVAHSEKNWRSSFFSFPLENLDHQAHHTLLSQSMLWISPFGESWLEAPPAAASGSQIPITLTLALANAQPMQGLRAEISLLPQTSLVPGSLQGDWNYDLVRNSLVWNGSLSPGEKIILKADLQLAENLPQNTALPLLARLYDSQGILAVAESPIQVGVPWLSLHGDYSSKEAYLGDTIAYTLTLRNEGVISDAVVLTVTLPEGESVIPGSIQAAQGSITSSQSHIQWSGEIQPHTQVLVYFSGRALPDNPGIRLSASAMAVDPYSSRKAWFTVTVFAQYYFPLIAR
jgi:uncharacterized repeat protein (TIGR01451 family)